MDWVASTSWTDKHCGFYTLPYLTGKGLDDTAEVQRRFNNWHDTPTGFSALLADNNRCLQGITDDNELAAANIIARHYGGPAAYARRTTDKERQNNL